MPMMTVRITDEQKAQLEALAQGDGVFLAEEIRQAIADRIEQKRHDPAFQARLREVMTRNQRLLGELSSD